ncbi:MAG TPA: DNA ligase D [Steroidobacteraceae bacterium]|nr:DNA ligase D [Steroidobacteraceae bacterium]
MRRLPRRAGLVRALHSLSGAKKVPPPGFIEPCLATSRASVPHGDQWIHEIKHDGYRAQAHLSGSTALVYTRRGYDWTDAFTSIADELHELPARSAILDGEIVVPDARGISDYHLLQGELAKGRSDRLVYYVFDVLYVEGFDLRAVPLIERKRVLSELLAQAPRLQRIRLSEHLEAEGRVVFEQACALHAEGIVCKDRHSPYRSGRQESWVKVKCRKSETYPIVAFVEKLGAKPRRIASLYLGRREDGRLLYAGKAQTGFKHEMLYTLRERLDPYIRKTSPLSVPIKKPKATWVEPVLDAEIEYSALTADKILRAPVFKGLRDDLLPARPSRRVHGASAPRVPQENILQLLPDAVVPGRAQLDAYWRKVSRRALRYLARRPLKLVRCVHGTTFYHRGPLPPIPPAVHQLKVQKREGGEGTRLWVDDLAGLLGLVAIGAIELHPWNSTVDDLEHPDVLVFDLDPGRGIDWRFVIDTAVAMRDLLRSEGLASWPKLTGGKGVHVMAPLARTLTHDEAHRYSRRLAERVAARDRARYTVAAASAERVGKLFIDYLRNGRGTTAVGTYSPRARPGFPIAAPVSWQALESGSVRPDMFTMQALPPSEKARSRRR